MLIDQDRLRILKDMGFYPGNMMFDAVNKRVLVIVADPYNGATPGTPYRPQVRAAIPGTGEASFTALVRDHWTLQMVPDMLSNLHNKLPSPRQKLMTKAVQEVLASLVVLHKEISILIGAWNQYRKD